jgi:hypothetical protein
MISTSVNICLTISHAKVGVYLAGETEVRLRGTEDVHSNISHCEVAVSLGAGLPPDFNLDDLELFVDFRNNEYGIRSAVLPPPGTTPPLQ